MHTYTHARTHTHTVYTLMHVRAHTHTHTEFNLHHPLHWSLIVQAVMFQNLIATLALCMHDALKVESYKINSSLH